MTAPLYTVADFAPGDVVTVAYTGYFIEAIVRAAPVPGLRSWLMVEQITDYEDVAHEDRPRFEVAVEYVVHLGPFTAAGFIRSAAALRC